MCTERGGRRAFLCPEGTRFNQRTLVCDHQERVECSEASSFFHRNLVLHRESVAATNRIRERKQNGEMTVANIEFLFIYLRWIWFPSNCEKMVIFSSSKTALL